MTALLMGVAAGFAVSVIMTRLVERAARRGSLMDVPDARSTHLAPLPRLGGIGIVAGFAVAYVLTHGPLDLNMAAILAAAVVLALVGLIDDVRGVAAPVKFGAQLLAAIVAALALTPELEIRAFGIEIALHGTVAVVVTVVWLMAITNAFNFTDGIDGIVAIVTIAISALGLALVGDAGRVMLVAIGSAALGFLVWNHHPARIFMGDVGSQFLGYTVGCALLLQPESSVAAIPMLLLISPLLVDTGLTLIRRILAREPIFTPHREHLYQRLVDSGVDQRAVAASYGLAIIVMGISAVLWPVLPAGAQLALLTAASAAVIWIEWWARRRVQRGSSLLT